MNLKACIVAVGSEMLTPFRVDTNSLAITEALNRIGYDVRLKAIVGDNVDELAALLRQAMSWADITVLSGGLGPTEDDITRDALASVFQSPLEIHEDVVDRIRDRFARRGRVMPEINRRQGLAPRGAILLENGNGTAPGLWLEREGQIVVAVPGPPREMKPMFDALIRERLAPRTSGAGLFRRVLKISGRSESDVDATVQPIYTRWVHQAVPISTTILAVLGQVELHLTAQAASRDEADRALEAAIGELAQALGANIYSTDGRPLEAIVGELLRDRTLTIAVAESCTGGLLTSRLTDVPGSSDYVNRGVVCYTNQSKTELLGVSPELLEAHGAVSEPVARAMAEGVRARAGVNVGIGVTGIAGPGGGSEQKPVGTVCLAVVVDSRASVRTFQFIGGREMVKFQATQSAMNVLRLMLLGAEDVKEWTERR